VDMEFDEAKGVLVGQLGEGPGYFEAASDEMAVPAAAMSMGIMQGSFKSALEYSGKRFQGGRKIIGWSEVQMILANMAIQLKIAELAVSRACQAVDNKEPKWQAGARATVIHVQEMACALTTDGIQVFGGVGYMKDYPQEKRFRDAKHVQALMGIAPMKKIKYLAKLTGA
jgi:alkylation response protein AidB-like acyl-CoA dehydrogenase